MQINYTYTESCRQLMILDIGCPKSLMGFNEYTSLVSTLSEDEKKMISKYTCNNKFKFGPSKVYKATFRVRLPLNLMHAKVMTSFYVLEGDIPILIGNDILEALGGVIHTDSKKLELKKLGLVLSMVKTNGGHFVLPVTRKKNDDIKEFYSISDECESENDVEEVECVNNVLGSEADAVMLLLLAECEEENDFAALHELIGHTTFVALALEEDEKKEVSKVHRYFGHKSGRRT